MQWLGSTSSNNNIVRNADGTIYTSKLPLFQTASAGNDKYNMQLMPSIFDLEDTINNELFSAEQDAAGTYVVFIYGSESRF